MHKIEDEMVSGLRGEMGKSSEEGVEVKILEDVSIGMSIG